MTLDYIITKIKRKKNICCFNCSKYLSNELRNMIDHCEIYSEGGGWCMPEYGKHYYRSIGPDDLICKNFKSKKKPKIKK